MNRFSEANGMDQRLLIHLLLVKADGSSRPTVTTPNVDRALLFRYVDHGSFLSVGTSRPVRCKDVLYATAIRGLRTQPYSG